MSRMNPAPDAQWIEIAKWEPRPRGRGLRRHVVDLMWIEADRAEQDRWGSTVAPAWRIVERPSGHWPSNRFFENTLAIRYSTKLGDREPWQPMSRQRFSVEIGWPQELDDKFLKQIGLPATIAMGIDGMEILKKMLARERELYEQGPPKAKRK